MAEDKWEVSTINGNPSLFAVQWRSFFHEQIIWLLHEPLTLFWRSSEGQGTCRDRPIDPIVSVFVLFCWYIWQLGTKNLNYLFVASFQMELRVGNKYRLGRKIGSGSFGDIYLGKTMEWFTGSFDSWVSNCMMSWHFCHFSSKPLHLCLSNYNYIFRISISLILDGNIDSFTRCLTWSRFFWMIDKIEEMFKIYP